MRRPRSGFAGRNSCFSCLRRTPASDGAHAREGSPWKIADAWLYSVAAGPCRLLSLHRHRPLRVAPVSRWASPGCPLNMNGMTVCGVCSEGGAVYRIDDMCPFSHAPQSHIRVFPKLLLLSNPCRANAGHATGALDLRSEKTIMIPSSCTG